MPNRVVREGILESERVSKLTWSSEVFYRRLMSIVDDYGCFDARVELLKVRCYPMVSGKVSNSDIEKWLNECVSAGLVRVYQVSGKNYLELLDFNQRLRQRIRKFPPPDDGQQVADNRQKNADNSRDEEKKNPKLNPNPKSKLNPTRAREESSTTTTDEKFDFDEIPPGKPYPLEELAELAHQDQGWKSDVAAAFSLGSELLVAGKIDQFCSHLRTKKVREKTEKDFREHFLSWLRKQPNESQKTQKNNGKTIAHPAASGRVAPDGSFGKL
ncbi:MAG: hypothetical protein DWQ44_00040 [Bacteroidetes bacterium]|nr:MAG: hypothetical protein DWQ44_00040 [Bacteroidota bacterium]